MVSISRSHGRRFLSLRTWIARLTVVSAIILTPSATVGAEGPPTGVSREEWTSIQDQIEVERHRVAASDHPGRLWRADNPAQRFTAHFGAEDVVLVPRGTGEPAWQLGLRLTGWGARNDLEPVDPAGAISEGNRVEYRRGPLTEWYVNSGVGLEQGFTIEVPPAADLTELVLEMTLDGDLTPVLADGGTAVTFRRNDSNTTLTYSGLKTWDAIDESLDARMELAGGGTRILLVISVANAIWPITIDPVFTQVAKLLPEITVDTQDAHFGQSVAIDGDLMVVSLDDRDDGYRSGSAFIFRRDQDGADEWGQIAKITPPDGTKNDFFGRSVAISGDTVVVGMPGDDDNGPSSGSAYIFQRDNGGVDAWGRVAKITPEDAEAGDNFGVSVAINGDTIMVGAYHDDGISTSSGSAYIFQRDQGGPNAWGQVAKITPDDGSGVYYFGYSVGISGDTVIVGAYGDNYNDHFSGSAFIFRRDQDGLEAWGQVAKITPDDGARFDEFGRSVSISGDTVVVGAADDDDNGSSSGSAYVFRRDQGGPEAWGQIAKITPDDGAALSRFGVSTSISGDTVIVGADEYDYLFCDSGSAYVFKRDQGGADAWGQIAKIVATDGSMCDRFGRSVAIDPKTVLVGAPATGDHGQSSGSAYIFSPNTVLSRSSNGRRVVPQPDP
jgi:FG-GAP repeat